MAHYPGQEHATYYPNIAADDAEDYPHQQDHRANTAGPVEIYNRHVPLAVRAVAHAEIVPEGDGSDPWRSDLRVSVLLPYDVEARSLSGQVVGDYLPDITSTGATLQFGFLTVVSPDVLAPPSCAPEQVFTITVPLTRGKLVHPPLLDRIHLNSEADPAIHHTLKIPGQDEKGRLCTHRIRTKIDPRTGSAYLASINADPHDLTRIKEALHNFAQASKHAAQAVKRKLAKKEATVPDHAVGPQATTNTIPAADKISMETAAYIRHTDASEPATSHPDQNNM